MKSLKALALALFLIAPVMAQDVMISEIMYNPDSPESAPNLVEWLEVYNYGTTAVDISGWYFQDEDGASGAFPAGTILMPGTAAVFFPDGLTAAGFQAAWPATTSLYPIGGIVFGSGTGLFGGDLGGLSNTPSATNEMLTLRDAAGTIVDDVNFDDVAPWPSITGSTDGPSIYVLPAFLNKTANDNGANWARSVVGTDGAVNNLAVAPFTGIDIGSPGFVQTPAPSFAVSVSHVAATASVDIVVTGGSPFFLYQIVGSFTNTGIAPAGPLFGINPTPAELTSQLLVPPFFGLLDASGNFFLSIGGVPAPLGIAFDYVAGEIDPVTNVITQVSPAIAGGF